MGVCHQCRCFYCSRLLSRECPVPRVCSTCYRGLNSRNYKIIHCDRYAPYEPVAVSTAKTPEKKKKSKKVFHFRKGKKGG